MGLVVAALLAALAVGALRGGSLTQLGALPLRAGRLVVVAFAVQLAATVVGGPAYLVGLAVATGLLARFLLVNRAIPGVALVALGLGLNALAVVANGGAMPVSREAALRAGVPLPALNGDPRHEFADADTSLRWLTDVVPVPLPLRPEVVSAGDVLVAAGLAQLAASGMQRSSSIPHGPSRVDFPKSEPRRRKGRQRRALPPLPGSTTVSSSPSPSTSRTRADLPSRRARARAATPRPGRS